MIPSLAHFEFAHLNLSLKGLKPLASGLSEANTTGHRVKCIPIPAEFAALTAVIPAGMSVHGVIVTPGIAALDPGLMA